jgi:hypothetical protein
MLGGAITALILVNQPPPRPDSIVISAVPTRTTYSRGETIVTAGMEITAAFPDGSVQTFRNGFTLSTTTASNGQDPTATDYTQTITVTFRKATTTFNIKVGPATLSRIEIVRPPNKVTYNVNEAPNWEGLLVRLTWTDRHETVGPTHPGLTISVSPGMNTAGSKNVFVSLQGSAIPAAMFQIIVS